MATRPKPPNGKYSVASWSKKHRQWKLSLTEQGRVLFDRYVASGLSPVLLLAKTHRRDFSSALWWKKRDPDAVRQAEVIAAWQTVARWKPNRSSFSNLLTFWVRSQIQALDVTGRGRQGWVDAVYPVEFDDSDALSWGKLRTDGLKWPADPAEQAEVKDERNRIGRVVTAELYPTLAKTVRRYFGLDGKGGATFKEVGQEMGVTDTVTHRRVLKAQAILHGALR